MNKSKPKPIPANVAAIWGAFLYQGMLGLPQNISSNKDIFSKWGEGCVELMAGACAFLPEVWRQIEPRWYEADSPGVFEYEVVSTLGVGLGDYLLLNNGDLPPREWVKDYVEVLISDFFQFSHRSNKHYSVPTLSVVERQ
jgi:hypothetical protein